jgi:hypothetical protein
MGPEIDNVRFLAFIVSGLSGSEEIDENLFFLDRNEIF